MNHLDPITVGFFVAYTCVLFIAISVPFAIQDALHRARQRRIALLRAQLAAETRPHKHEPPVSRNWMPEDPADRHIEQVSPDTFTIPVQPKSW